MKKEYKYNIEAVRIPASTFQSGDLVKLLRAAKAVNDAGTHSHPGDVYVHPADARRIRKALKRHAKKLHKYLVGRRLETAVAMHWLNLGPNESTAAKLGYALVDRRAIAIENKRLAHQEPGQYP